MNKKNKIFLYKGDNIDIFPSLKNSEYKPNIIYLDPPYNTKNSNLLYNDSFSRDIKWEEEFEKRLVEINKIIQENSIIYTSIGTEELVNAKISLDNVFGKKSFCSIMPRITHKTSKTSKTISKINDFVIIYKKGNVSFNQEKIDNSSYKEKDEYFEKRGAFFLRYLDYKDFSYNKNSDYIIEHKGKKYFASGSEEKYLNRKKEPLNKDWCWLWSEKKYRFAVKNNFIVFKNNRVYKKTYFNSTIAKNNKGEYEIKYEKKSKPFSSLELTDLKYKNEYQNKNKNEKLFSYPKSSNLLKFLFELPKFSEKNVLDPYAGTGISGKIASELNLNCILIQKEEEIEKNTEAYKMGFKNVYDLTKEILKENLVSFEEK